MSRNLQELTYRLSPTKIMQYLALFTWVAGTLLARRGDAQQPQIIPTKRIGLDVHGLPVLMPLYGAGTWQYNDTIAYQSLCKSFFAGVTFVDTAFGYGNQVGVGKAIADCYQGLRHELFVMTKVPGGLSAEGVKAAHVQNLADLRLDYVDHLMTHFPSDWDEKVASKKDRQEEWLALEQIYYSGQARSIGISHYCPSHIDDILEVATVRPTINQVEYHIGSGDVDGVMEKCKQEGITFMSFSPLCGPCQYEPADSLVHGTLVTEIGRQYNVSGAQVALRFIVQQALDGALGAVIPKSNNGRHIRQNMDIFSFEISDTDMERLHEATQPSAEGGDCEVP